MIFANRAEWRQVLALGLTVLRAPGSVSLLKSQQQADSVTTEKAKLNSAEHLDSQVAPIVPYPDPLLAQVLAAPTFPLKIVLAHRCVKASPNLKSEDLTNAAAKQPWDASDGALVAFPGALKLLDDNVQGTIDLGYAFLDQQNDVLVAIQWMRKKAKDGGKLESTKEQTVEITTICLNAPAGSSAPRTEGWSVTAWPGQPCCSGVRQGDRAGIRTRSGTPKHS